MTPKESRAKLAGYIAVIGCEVIALAVAVLFGVALLEPHLLGNVEGTGSPTWFWASRHSSVSFLVVAGIALLAAASLELLRRFL